MMTPAVIQRYWLLTNILLFPLRGLNWVMALGVVLVLVGLPIYFIWNNPLCVGFGVMLVMLPFLVSSIFMPNQILFLNSSKQFGLLPRLRYATFMLCFIYCLIASASLTLIFALKNHVNWVQLFFAAFVMVSAFVVGSLLIALQWKWAQGFLFMVFAVLPTVAAWLITIDPQILLGGLMAGWFAFLYWWLSWRPVKLHKVIFGQSKSEMLKNQQDIQLFWAQGALLLGKNKPQTLLGTLLLGSADGWQPRLKNLIFGLFFAFLFIGLYRALLGSAILDVLSRQADVFFFIAYASSSFAFHGHLFRNLHKLWMFYPESRKSLFLQVEKIYYPWALIVMAPLAIMHLIAPMFISAMINDHIFTVLLVIFAVVLLAFNFYIGMAIYCKTHANYSWIMWLGTGFMFVCMAIAWLLFLMWADHKEQLITISLGFLIALFGVVVLLRHWAQKCWLCVDFVRVQN